MNTRLKLRNSAKYVIRNSKGLNKCNTCFFFRVIAFVFSVDFSFVLLDSQRVTDREKKKEREKKKKRSSILPRSYHKCLQQPELGQAKVRKRQLNLAVT